MKKKRINDIFYSLQGEGYYAGRAAVFIRFSGCNLQCPFCDTDFSAYREMTDKEIIEEATRYKSDFVVLTGGEPSLQVDEAFVSLLHKHGFEEVAMESNGTRPVPDNVDWLTLSPKVGFVGRSGQLAMQTAEELKCIYDGETPVDDWDISALYYYLQPCDVGDPVRNAAIMKACVRYIQEHPQWRLSLQTHKLAGFK